MEVVPVVCRAMVASGTPITLDSIYDALGRGGLARLGRTPGAEQYRQRLEDLEHSGGLGTANLPYYIYQTFYTAHDYGRASAAGVVVVIGTIFIATFALRSVSTLFKEETGR